MPDSYLPGQLELFSSHVSSISGKATRIIKQIQELDNSVRLLGFTPVEATIEYTKLRHKLHGTGDYEILQRQIKQRSNGVCERAFCDEIAEEIHHKILVRERPELFFDLSNCEHLCVMCHKIETEQQNFRWDIVPAQHSETPQSFVPVEQLDARHETDSAVHEQAAQREAPKAPSAQVGTSGDSR